MDTYRFCSKCQQFVLNETVNGNHHCHKASQDHFLRSYCKDSNSLSTQALTFNKNKDNREKK